VSEGPAPAPILEARNLRKRYGGFVALEDVSLHMEPGEVVGFLGPNGAGKTTTMKILTGFVAPSGGDATIGGHNLRAEPLACRRLIGYLPQEAPLYGDMKVDAYLDHVARLKGVPANRRHHEVSEVAGLAHLHEVRGRHIHKLSGGNRQRVGLAQALIGSPPILILDEPTAGLDPAQVANFRDLLVQLSDRHSILLSTHIMAEVEACCRRVVVVHRGRDILQAPVSELRRRSREMTRLRLRLADGDEPAFAGELAKTDWAANVSADDDGVRVEAPPDARGRLVELAQSAGGLAELVEEHRSLEEVFRDLIKD